MKQNFTTTFSYFIYLGMTMLMHPATKFSYNASVACTDGLIAKETKVGAPPNEDVLHSELLFKY